MLETWHWLQEEGEALLGAVGQEAAIDPATIQRLRKDWPAPAVSAAIELVSARRKASTKFTYSDRLFADLVGVEQATSQAVADHKAARFKQAGITSIDDLCCGIGGDAMSLAQVADVTLIDADPLRTWMAKQNVQAATGKQVHAQIADVTQLDLRDRSVHLDPARRTDARRIHQYEDYQPGPDFIEDLLTRCPDSAVKLGPGVDLDALPPGEIEMIEENNTLVQAVLWSGKLVQHQRSATVLPAGETISGSPEFVPVAEVRDYLYAVRPCVERAGLVGNLCTQTGAQSTHPQLGLLTADQPVTSPFLTAFRHLHTLPWRQKKVKDWLNQHDAGLVEIKTRGGAVNPDPLQRQLRGTGTTAYTLFILRYDDRVITHITQRL